MPRIALLLIGYLSLLSCTNQHSAVTAAPTSPLSAPAQTYVFECPDGFSFVARTEANAAWLFLPGNTIELTSQHVASGSEYAKGGYRFRLIADKAMIVTYEGKHTDCRNNRSKAIWEHAKLNGVDFRALGNEPGWYLEISNRTEILLVADYGQHRYRFQSATIEADPDHRTTRYKARNNGDAIEVTIAGSACRDTMSGASFAATVAVLVNGKRYHGCGKALH